MNVLFKLAEISELDTLVKIKKNVWNTNLRGVYNDEEIDRFDEEKEKHVLMKILENDKVDLYSIFVDDMIVGFMSCGEPYRKFEDYEGEVGLLYILKDYQRKGIGKMALELAKDNLKRKGLKKFFISCNFYNLESRKFYEKMGGKVVFIDELNEINKRSVQVKFHYDI